MTAAAFRATFTDWRLIKGRKVVQVVLEVPVESADQAYQVLGGMPNPAESVWCAVARLQTTKDGDAHSNVHPGLPERNDTPPTPLPDKAERARRSWEQLSAAEQAGIRCTDPLFHKFLKETVPHMWGSKTALRVDNRAVHIVREICGVESRAQINAANPKALARWNNIDTDFRIWQMGVVG
jgi:hypothetical protein